MTKTKKNFELKINFHQQNIEMWTTLKFFFRLSFQFSLYFNLPCGKGTNCCNNWIERMFHLIFSFLYFFFLFERINIDYTHDYYFVLMMSKAKWKNNFKKLDCAENYNSKWSNDQLTKLKFILNLQLFLSFRKLLPIRSRTKLWKLETLNKVQ